MNKQRAETVGGDMAERRSRLSVSEGGQKVESCDRRRVMNLIGFGSNRRVVNIRAEEPSLGSSPVLVNNNRVKIP